MINIDDINKIIELLPKLVLYIVPGYFSLTIYYASRDQKAKENRLLIARSVFLSYLYVTAAGAVLGNQAKNDIWKALLIVLISVVVGLFTNFILKTKFVKWIMNKIHHTTLSNNIIDEVLEIGTGVYMRLYLEDGIRYEGYLIRDKLTDSGKHYLILDCYRKTTIERQNEDYVTHQKHNYDNDHTRCVVVDIDKVTHLELKYDKLAKKDNREI